MYNLLVIAFVVVGLYILVLADKETKYRNKGELLKAKWIMNGIKILSLIDFALLGVALCIN